MAAVLPLFAGLGGTGAAAAGGGFSLGSLFSIGGGVLGAVGALASAGAARQAADYNAKVNENQAITVNNDAAMRATALQQKNRQRIAAARAGGLENGIGEGGSSADVLDTINKQGTLDSLTAIYDGTVRSTGLRNSAELDRMQANNAGARGGIGAFASIFDGFSRAFA
jgi:hypothetical protein